MVLDRIGGFYLCGALILAPRVFGISHCQACLHCREEEEGSGAEEAETMGGIHVALGLMREEGRLQWMLKLLLLSRFFSSPFVRGPATVPCFVVFPRYVRFYFIDEICPTVCSR